MHNIRICNHKFIKSLVCDDCKLGRYDIENGYKAYLVSDGTVLLSTKGVKK